LDIKGEKQRGQLLVLKGQNFGRWGEDWGGDDSTCEGEKRDKKKKGVGITREVIATVKPG